MSELEKLIGGRFDALSDTFPSSIDAGDARLQALLRSLGDIKGKKVLEVGCGKGRFLREVAKNGARCTGIDLSENFLKEARAKGAGFFLKGSAAAIPFGAGVFDAVFAVEVIEHLPGLEDFIREARRVLKHDGKLIIIDRNKFSINNRRFLMPNIVIKRYHELKNEWMYPRNFPFRERWFNPARVRSILEQYFTVSGYEYILGYGERKRWWHFIFRIIPPARHFVLWYSADGKMAMQDSRPVSEISRGSVIKEFGFAHARVREKVAKEPGIIRSVRASNPLKGVFCLRMDADEYSNSSFKNYYDIFETYKNAVTIFFNVNSFKDAVSELKRCGAMSIDIQSHGFFHHTYNDYKSNLYNIKKAKLFFEKIGIRTKGFASPMGRWNWALMRALEDEGYEYSTDFEYDYLGLPSYPAKGNLISKILEIPIFPVAPELFYQHGIMEEDIIISYYKGAIDEMVRCNLPVIIYAHTSLQYRDVPKVLQEIARYAVSDKRLLPKNMTEMSRIWRNASHLSNSAMDIKIPHEEYMGREVNEPVYSRIKTAVKDYIDFERVTPMEELQGPLASRLFKKLIRKYYKHETGSFK